jgi:hypothetical protein
MSQNRRKNYRKDKKIYLVKKTKMKIQNKYVFRTIISEFLYLKKKKTHRSGTSVAARPKALRSGKELIRGLKINPLD